MSCSHLTSGYRDALRRVFKDTGRLLVAFLIGSVATVAGTLVAIKLLPLTDMGVDGWKVCLLVHFFLA
jgi:ferric-chelate reductase